MTMFTFHKDRILTTKQGHSIQFEKGKPVHVPPECYFEALNIGAEPDEKADEPEDAEQRGAPPDDPVKKKQVVMTAFEQLATENDSKKFTGTGMPTAKALKEQLGFELDAVEAKALWLEYAQSKGKK